ncbi:MAG: helix-turn-helix transcriptional regulator [Clostridium lundense]|nr:helix-turn-helix transcriptional regulator [Clostridium lundense]
MNIQEVYRQKLIQYTESKGIKYNYIAKQLKVSPSLICHWIKGRRALREDLLKKLNLIIDS